MGSLGLLPPLPLPLVRLDVSDMGIVSCCCWCWECWVCDDGGSGGGDEANDSMLVSTVRRLIGIHSESGFFVVIHSTSRDCLRMNRGMDIYFKRKITLNQFNSEYVVLSGYIEEKKYVFWENNVKILKNYTKIYLKNYTKKYFLKNNIF